MFFLSFFLQVEDKVFKNVELFKRENQSGKREWACSLPRGPAMPACKSAHGQCLALPCPLLGSPACPPTSAMPAAPDAATARLPVPRCRPAAKKEGDQLFECFDAQDLNVRLKDLMEGLSVKVGASAVAALWRCCGGAVVVLWRCYACLDEAGVGECERACRARWALAVVVLGWVCVGRLNARGTGWVGDVPRRPPLRSRLPACHHLSRLLDR